MVEASPGVTVVVPTLNRGEYLLDTVRDLLAQEHRPLEILIVDQSETVSPELEELVSANPEIISHHRVTFRGLPMARNYAWQKARHDLIVYVDDDIRCGTNLVSEHVRSLCEPGVGMSAGGIDEVRGEDLPTQTGVYDRWRVLAARGFNADGEFDVEHMPGGNFGAQRDVLSMVGGLDERLGAGSALLEETELALRVTARGWRIPFIGTARLTHLAAGGGGTRQPNWRRYVHALSHNRSILIRRHSRWYQWPIALAWSGKLVVAYTFHARDPRLILDGVRGAIQGWRAGGLPPLCTRFETD